MKKLIFNLVLAILVVSCTQESENTLTENQSVISEDFSIEVKSGFFTTTYDINETSLDEIINLYVETLYEEELQENQYVGINIRRSDNLFIVDPISGVKPVTTNGDDEKCGGKEGDGWTSYGVCYSKECVKETSSEAGAEMSLTLSPGECMDIRVKRNKLNARVCGRKISCE